ncbi:MAG TPA: hypothetical protein VM597_27095 [Gemmataceae bacterium]|nr:hypothetical protein [Gemmataceae bacterium]
MAGPVYCPACETPLPPSHWSAPGPLRCRECGTEFVPPPRPVDENPRPRRRLRPDDRAPRRTNSILPIAVLAAAVAVGILTAGVAAYVLAVR